MSKQEVTSGESAPVVVVEQTVSSRHKLYRPTEMQQEASSELHKRSVAPAVPLSSTERQSHHVKKSSSKRREPSPEDIAMVLMDIQKDGIATVPQPIPGAATAVSESKVAGKIYTEKKTVEDNIAELEDIAEQRTAEKIFTEKKADEDSVAEREDIAEPRTAEDVNTGYSNYGGLPRSVSRGSRVSRTIEQPTNSSAVKKKEISWEDNEYLENVPLPNEGAKSQAVLLERTASVGPCFKPKMLFGGPSGIFVCVPKKSVRSVKEDSIPIQSVINFNISKKLESNSAPHIEARYQKGIPKKADGQKQKLPKKLEKELKIECHPKFFEVLRGKIDNMTSKIRNLLNM